MAYKKYYKYFSLVPLDEVFVWPIESHSMSKSLDPYVENRLPTAFLNVVSPSLKNVEVLGVYPDHFEHIMKDLGISSSKRVAYQPKPYIKQFNFIRPYYYLSDTGDELYVCVPPGMSYLKQYTSLLRYYFMRRKLKPNFTVKYFPNAALSIAAWTGLDKEQFNSKLPCLVGHVDEFVKHCNYTNLKLVTDNDHFTRFIMDTSDQTKIELLGFKFSFWGDISGQLVERLYDNGCKEVIYFGKVGALDRGIELYQKVIVPRSFMLAEHDRIVCEPFTVPNGLADHLDSQTAHVSTPTVMEQDYIQRSALESFNPSSIDNEIAYMAQAANNYNVTHPPEDEVRFSSISFATDYVRRSHECNLPAKFDLSNNRSKEALDLRQSAAKMITDSLCDYLVRRRSLL